MNHLLEKIKKIEALIAGAQTAGEREAAISARDRILRNNPALRADVNARESSSMRSRMISSRRSMRMRM